MYEHSTYRSGLRLLSLLESLREKPSGRTYSDIRAELEIGERTMHRYAAILTEDLPSFRGVPPCVERCRIGGELALRMIKENP